MNLGSDSLSQVTAKEGSSKVAKSCALIASDEATTTFRPWVLSSPLIVLNRVDQDDDQPQSEHLRKTKKARKRKRRYSIKRSVARRRVVSRPAVVQATSGDKKENSRRYDGGAGETNENGRHCVKEVFFQKLTRSVVQQQDVLPRRRNFRCRFSPEFNTGNKESGHDRKVAVSRRRKPHKPRWTKRKKGTPVQRPTLSYATLKPSGSRSARTGCPSHWARSETPILSGSPQASRKRDEKFLANLMELASSAQYQPSLDVERLDPLTVKFDLHGHVDLSNPHCRPLLLAVQRSPSSPVHSVECPVSSEQTRTGYEESKDHDNYHMDSLMSQALSIAADSDLELTTSVETKENLEEQASTCNAFWCIADSSADVTSIWPFPERSSACITLPLSEEKFFNLDINELTADEPWLFFGE